MTISTTPTCATCLYAARTAAQGVQVIGETAKLECRRYPPTVHIVHSSNGGIGFMSAYPPVEHACWEWSPAESH
jgi:hypothetical protein